MQNLKCPNCGADITTDDAQVSGKCSYCNSRFATEKKRPTPPPQQSTTEPLNSAKDVFRPIITVNNNTPRPRLRVFWLILSLMFGPFFFIGYIVLTEMRKKSWDAAHNQ